MIYECRYSLNTREMTQTVFDPYNNSEHFDMLNARQLKENFVHATPYGVLIVHSTESAKHAVDLIKHYVDTQLIAYTNASRHLLELMRKV